MAGATRHIPALGAAVLALVSCTRPETHTTPPSAEVQVPRPAPASSPRPEVSAARAPRPELPTIDDDGVGDVRLDQPIPESQLADAREAKSRYEIRWVADAQPFEAFRLATPPVLAQFHGPFTAWAKSNVGEIDKGRFVDEAIRQARAGARVHSIVVDAKGARTHAGIGVGSSYEELSKAHPDAKISRLPEWFDSRPTCSVQVPELSRVWFHLSSCGKEPGDVIRILVMR